MRQITVDQVYEDNRKKLELTWVAGRSGGSRTLFGQAALKPTVGQIGHLNFIHPFRIQVVGAAEVAYLDGLSLAQRQLDIDRLFNPDLVAVIIANGEMVPDYLEERCVTQQVVLFSTPQPSPHVVDVLRLYLAKVLAESTNLHGVFLDVLGLGVLITGASAVGKSELALELISRGHGLIADDIVELYRVAPDSLEGRCPEVLRDFLEVRGIGILNIRTIFGETAVRPRKTLKLIVHLEDWNDRTLATIDRLGVKATYQEIIGVPIRKVAIPVAAGRNLAVLVEAAVRNCILQLRGIDSTRELVERQQRFMEEGGG